MANKNEKHILPLAVSFKKNIEDGLAEKILDLIQQKRRAVVKHFANSPGVTEGCSSGSKKKKIKESFEKKNLQKVLTSSEFKIIENIYTGKLNKDLWDDYPKIAAKIEKYFSDSGDMPTSVQKGQTRTPDEWVHEQLERVFESVLSEADQRAIKIVNRIRKGKVQRKKKISGKKGFRLKGNRLVKISSREGLKRRLGAKRGSIKRKAKKAIIKRKRRISIKKRKRLGFDRR